MFPLLGCSNLFNNKAVRATESQLCVAVHNAVTVLSDPQSFSFPSLYHLAGWCVFFLSGFCALLNYKALRAGRGTMGLIFLSIYGG